MNEITGALSRLRLRMMGQFFFDRFGFCALVFGANLFLVAVVNRLQGGSALDGRFAGWFLITAAGLAALWTFTRMPSLQQTAARIDGIACTHDRFATAYAFSRIEPRSALQEAAMLECAGFIRNFDVKSHTTFRLPKTMPWLLIPVTALVVLAYLPEHKPLVNTASAATADQTRQLEAIAKIADAMKSEDLRKIADEIRNSEKRMQAAPPEDARKEALREMSSLENMIQDLLKRKEPFSPEEAAALADALKKSNLTKEAAELLEAGKAADAAAKLEQLAKERQQDLQLDEIARALQEAMRNLAQNQRSDAGRQLEQSMQQGSSASQALQRLAQQLRNSPGGAKQDQQQGNGNGERQTLKAALAALQNMKYSSRQPNATADSPQKNGAQTSVQSFSRASQSQKNGEQHAAIADLPTGAPGSEHDEGTTKTPLGDPQKKSADMGTAAHVDGQLGAGQSLHDFISATGDTSKSQRSYRDLYNAMLPAAEDALMQESIPPGSRFYIKRYFEAIRPKE